MQTLAIMFFFHGRGHDNSRHVTPAWLPLAVLSHSVLVAVLKLPHAPHIVCMTPKKFFLANFDFWSFTLSIMVNDKLTCNQLSSSSQVLSAGPGGHYIPNSMGIVFMVCHFETCPVLHKHVCKNRERKCPFPVFSNTDKRKKMPDHEVVYVRLDR